MSDRQQFEHLSYGRVTVTKPMGNIKLFGSEVRHQNCVAVTVEHAVLEQDVRADHVFGRKHVVEFYLSEAQWAHMLSSFGDGSGTPVTLRWTQDTGYIEPPPDLPTVVDVQRREVDAEVKKLAAKMQAIETKLEAMLALPTIKKKDVEGLRMSLNILRSHFTSNLPYYEKAVIERMEMEVAKAKIEIDAIVQNYVRGVGLKTIQSGQAEPLRLE